MCKIFNTKGGFTLVEVLVSVGIMVVFLPIVASILVSSQVLASLSKHKIQAAYVAQQILETERQTKFTSLQNVNPLWLILDTKGNYNNTGVNNCTVSNTNTSNFCGEYVVTVTSSVYTNSANQKTTSTLVDHVLVKVYWSENIFNKLLPMTESYAEDIANDPMLN